MTDDDRLAHLLRSALTATDSEPSRELWPRVVEKMHRPAAPSWLDVGMAAVVGVLLIMFPNWLLFLAYHF